MAGGIRQREYVIALVMSFALTPEAQDAASLDVAATKAVPDPCREDLHVSSIQTGAWYFDVPLVFADGRHVDPRPGEPRSRRERQLRAHILAELRRQDDHGCGYRQTANGGRP